MAEREASGDFDYLIGDVADGSGGEDGPPDPGQARDLDYAVAADDQWGDPDEAYWADQAEPSEVPEGPTDSFDAFNPDSWYFAPAPPPWYRTKPAMTALIGAAAAAAALVVSAVLLVFRGPGTAVEDSTSITPAAPTTVASSERATSPEPPPPGPPPPPETSAEPIAPAPAPAQTNRPRAPRSTKAPEIGVTRTPVTRSPISVAPQRPGTQR